MNYLSKDAIVKRIEHVKLENYHLSEKIKEYEKLFAKFDQEIEDIMRQTREIKERKVVREQNIARMKEILGPKSGEEKLQFLTEFEITHDVKIYRLERSEDSQGYEYYAEFAIN